MAFRKTLTNRFLHMAKTCGSHLRSGPTPKHPPEPDLSLLRPSAGRLLDRIRVLSPDRIRLDCLRPPLNPNPNPNPMSAREVRKVLRAAQMEAARSRLVETGRSCVSHDEFVGICCEASNSEQGPAIAKSLDESGAVVVFGNLVLLRPDQIAKAIESAIPLSLPQQNDSHKEELREMEEKKAVIDKRAEAGVKRELWCGLGFLVMQTMGFMRLTFWDLSWDVMEPICFYVTSIYFMAGYGFFLRTSREPSFEGFFQSRFAAKQKRLMKAYNFDLGRFNQLKSACGALAPLPIKDIASSSSSPCNCGRRDVHFGIAH
ncbi:calcium uniporter protein 2, mitochondrial-like isoform X1 [Iris pallida]|uniref:Calcium uniporter protein 2, mitochondrial-like isoform X1 n=1 Tax=Iris pallida TaxID=29817 RepID=A0AAX6DL07_IRIPA|nr:calcium uniporter protein 2, mitochondrial-like isoform X1 [Iris pallida]KAJ6814021.1 calcium uniporter protein 2, mitochondrial-like isoform X1 [Iris pallida]